MEAEKRLSQKDEGYKHHVKTSVLRDERNLYGER